MAALNIQQGNPVVIPLLFRHTDTGEAYNLTGKTIFFTVKNIIDFVSNDDSAVIKKEVTVHTNPSLGESAITLSDTDTELPTGRYKFDLKIKDADTNINTSTGILCIVDKITFRTV